MNMQNLLSEEKFNSELWYVLEKLNYEALKSTPSKTIAYISPYHVNSEIDQGTEQMIFNQLERLGVVKKVKGYSGLMSPDEYQAGNSKGLIFHFELTSKFEKFYQKYKSKMIGSNDSKQGILTMNMEGLVQYVDSKGKKYKCVLNPATNPYKLLKSLIMNPQNISFQELQKKLNPQTSDPERWIRDTLQSFRSKLKLMNMKKDEFLVVDKKTVCIKCKMIWSS